MRRARSYVRTPLMSTPDVHVLITCMLSVPQNLRTIAGESERLAGTSGSLCASAAVVARLGADISACCAHVDATACVRACTYGHTHALILCLQDTCCHLGLNTVS
eukprot:6200613-Pleurochrysis_carterae.AAC.3